MASQEHNRQIHVDETPPPRFCRPIILPYALRGNMNVKIDYLAKSGIIQPEEFSDWAASIVLVVKRDGSIHI